MTIRSVVIAGAGQAGYQAAASLRREGFDGSILILGEEPGLPYQRPPLSKTYLKEGKAERLLLCSAEFFARNSIDFADRTRIEAIDRTGRCVRDQNGKTYPFDHLILAVGTRNRKLPLPGHDAENVVKMRTLGDADDIRGRIAQARHIAVIGGGFIGLEFAAVAREFCTQVTVVEALPRLMARAVSEPISEFFVAAHRANGVDIRVNTTLREIGVDAHGKVASIELSDGTRIRCDLVLIAVGVVPNSEIAEAAELTTLNGIVVDNHLLTRDPRISAIGDCASFPFDGRFIRLESVQNAVDQAQCVAKRISGVVEPYSKVPWFWSDQGPHKLQMTGLTAGADQHVVRGSFGDNRLSVFCFRNGVLVGVETVNAPRDHMAARKTMALPARPTADALEMSGFDLKVFVG